MLLARVERDLTGDGKPETLRLVGVGPSLDSLAVTFTIESSGQMIFRMQLEPFTRNVGFDGGRNVESAEQHRARLKDFGQWFFADAKFQSPSAFVADLRNSVPDHMALIPEAISHDRPGTDSIQARVIWQEIQRTKVTVFTFSPGGDGIKAIAWNSRTHRFYNLLECC